jgi:AAA+ ATPase superfamily predicted ATPase
MAQLPRFVNREEELDALDRWWNRSGASMGLVWGRRRVGKTALMNEFARDRLAVFHTASARPASEELAALGRAAGLDRAPVDWEDALERIASTARRERLLLVLDEFPELVGVTPELPSVLRAFWDRARGGSRLKLLLCGSAVRTMEAIQEERSALYGRIDLRLLMHPFRPHETAALLDRLAPADRALVWGICGGVPLYLEWWDQQKSVRDNLAELVCRPGGLLLTEGQLVLATEVEAGLLPQQVLRAIALGRTKHNEIADEVRADPTRTLERLVELRLVERLTPVTEDPRRTRRRIYRIADNFLAFWLGVVDRYRTEIERGLGQSILPVLESHLDDYMGPRWEEAFRQHLRRVAGAGDLGEGVVAIGPFWTADGSVEIDAVALAGRERQAVLVGEAKWSQEMDGRDVLRDLERKAGSLPRLADDARYALAARGRVRRPEQALVVSADEIFG